MDTDGDDWPVMYVSLTLGIQMLLSRLEARTGSRGDRAATAAAIKATTTVSLSRQSICQRVFAQECDSQ